MRSTLRVKCAQRAPRTTESITTWARSVIAAPAAHCATAREAEIVAVLLAEVELTGGAR